MEKWQETYEEALKNDNIKKRGTKYLNDILNMVDSPKRVDSEFSSDIYRIDKANALEIINTYVDIANMLRYSYLIYRDTIDFFERQVLQINSVISTSLIVEYRIHDILFQKNLLLESTKKDIQRPNYFYDDLIKTLQDLKKQPLSTQNLKEIEAVLNEAIQRSKDEKTQKDNNEKQIQEFKKSAYYIATMSKDKNLISLLRSLLMNYVSNDILEGVRNAFFKKYGIKIINDKPKEQKVHCLKVGACEITQNKIADIMTLSLTNEGKCVIDKKAFDLFTLFVNIEAETKKAEYKNLLNKYIKFVSKEMDETQNKADTIACCVISNAELFLQEMGWCDIEQE